MTVTVMRWFRGTELAFFMVSLITYLNSYGEPQLSNGSLENILKEPFKRDKLLKDRQESFNSLQTSVT